MLYTPPAQTVLTTPLFRDVYGVDSADLGFVWLAGPLSGLVVQVGWDLMQILPLLFYYTFLEYYFPPLLRVCLISIFPHTF